jgi:hypothetical protein
LTEQRVFKWRVFERRFVEQCFELHEPFRLSDWMPNPKLPNRAEFFAGIEVLIPAWQLLWFFQQDSY